MEGPEDVSAYFEAWFEAGARASAFFKRHAGGSKAKYSRTPKGAIAIYNDATPEIKASFAQLPVERQMAILLVPVRGQARYKKSGLGAYIEWKESPESGKRERKVTKSMKEFERNVYK